MFVRALERERLREIKRETADRREIILRLRG